MPASRDASSRLNWNLVVLPLITGAVALGIGWMVFGGTKTPSVQASCDIDQGFKWGTKDGFSLSSKVSNCKEETIAVLEAMWTNALVRKLIVMKVKEAAKVDEIIDENTVGRLSRELCPELRQLATAPIDERRAAQKACVDKPIAVALRKLRDGYEVPFQRVLSREEFGAPQSVRKSQANACNGSQYLEKTIYISTPGRSDLFYRAKVTGRYPCDGMAKTTGLQLNPKDVYDHLKITMINPTASVDVMIDE